jgi:hypothetical protein
MKLATLITEIERSRGPVTGIELALRLGIQPAEVAAMLSALRASGRLGPAPRSETTPGECSSSGACSMSCPGPGDCPLVIDVSVNGLEMKGW